MKHLLPLLLFLASVSLYAQTGIDSLLALVKPEKQDTQQVNLLVRIARQMQDEGESHAIQYADQALTLAGKLGYNKGIADAYAAKGLCEEGSGNFVKAIRNQQLAFATYLAMNDSLGQAKALGNMANNEYFIGDYTASAEHSFAALALYDKLNYKYGLLATHFAVGNVLLDQSSYNGALEQYRDAYNIALTYNDHPEYKARALAAIGNVYNYWHKDDSAAYFYIVSDSTFEKLNRTYEISIVTNNLGTIRQRQERFEEAEQLFRRSLSLRRSTGDSDGVCSSYQNIGSLLLDLKKADSALFYFHAALRLAKISSSRSQQVSCYQGLAETFAFMKKFDSAYYYLDRFTTLNDSIKGEESVSQVTMLKERYEEEKQQRVLDQLAAQRQVEKEESARKIILLIGGILLLILVISIVVYRGRVRRRINSELEKQNAEISAQKKHITDSIDYAKKIQDSILPPDHLVHAAIPDSFILYEPKDVVSGDFYWVEQRDGISLFSAVDCTGHGVPGALMSVVGFNLLTQAVNEKGLTKPSEILAHLDFGVNKLLRQSDAGSIVKDGMDLALCAIDLKSRVLQFAGAFNPVYIVHRGELVEIKADKFPIGINTDGKVDEYTNHSMQLDKGDMIYLSSDGYADQFGGPLGKKFKYNRLRELLKNICMLPVDEQRRKLKEEFLGWKGEHEQVDDILIIGVRV